ncbi:MAG: rhodanese-like domain-containing protein [Zetaproteobacteria bacterium CG12_big_fil_rev_8_21_14_0_65_54_13]|nr:MAG: rhodanese-like domain-containing protein [Zetaproteobacteria bacterium CG12_big_fil_rev_8_21_14_0_65_54_13]PIX53734.1 MAG: rhodanese-like domain-containing protein [Zetaproteobacteria bacterium CG_4_10_14_3_um_filter_54_28]PJA31171.1 MAG: rhodanese-like domain-containing protein [Zetaproteobacteria bacterium CG_4_9_14_3_um_filter_54_145]
MKRIIWTMAALIMMPVMVSACGMGEQTPEGYENATVAHTHEHWQQGVASPVPFMLLDVRTQEEYAEGHIAGAILIPVQVLAERLSEVPHDKQVYVYCHSGARSARASTLLARKGYTNIENMMGGIVAWKAAGYPVE